MNMIRGFDYGSEEFGEMSGAFNLTAFRQRREPATIDGGVAGDFQQGNLHAGIDQRCHARTKASRDALVMGFATEGNVGSVDTQVEYFPRSQHHKHDLGLVAQRGGGPAIGEAGARTKVAPRSASAEHRASFDHTAAFDRRSRDDDGVSKITGKIEFHRDRD